APRGAAAPVCVPPTWWSSRASLGPGWCALGWATARRALVGRLAELDVLAAQPQLQQATDRPAADGELGLQAGRAEDQHHAADIAGRRDPKGNRRGTAVQSTLRARAHAVQHLEP